jgi:glutamate dehydrogenase (NAD(P)+)
LPARSPAAGTSGFDFLFETVAGLPGLGRFMVTARIKSRDDHAQARRRRRVQRRGRGREKMLQDGVRLTAAFMGGFVADEPHGGHDAGGPDDGGPRVVVLASVPGFVVFDLPGAELSAGGTRLAPDVSAAEVALLARAMTYKYAALREEVGGAKAGLRGDPADRAGKAELMARFCAEVGPLIAAKRFITGPDMGTSEEDFAPLREHRAVPSAMSAIVGGLPFEDMLTGFGVAAAADAALSARSGWGWDGRSVAIEGFGKVGGGVAREVARRGGRVVAVSTIAGYIADPSGLDVEMLLALRQAHGDACVAHYGRPVGPAAGLFTDVRADVVVPGTRPGRIDERAAGSLPPGVLVVAPAANAPYTERGAEVLRERGVLALPDFVCNAGAVIGYRSDADASPAQVLARAEAIIAGVIREALGHPDGPLAGACEMAGKFLRGWWGEPPSPPFAPAA